MHIKLMFKILKISSILGFIIFFKNTLYIMNFNTVFLYLICLKTRKICSFGKFVKKKINEQTYINVLKVFLFP
jgi:hypothetical protein